MAERDYPSKAEKLPPSIKAEIGRLRLSGWSIDQILERLRDMGVQKQDLSRSGLGRHIAQIRKRTERLRRSRDVSQALVEAFGQDADNKAARVNIEMMHDILAGLMDKVFLEEGDDGVVLDPGEAMKISKALHHLAAARKGEVEVIELAKKDAREEAAANFEKVAKIKGMKAKTLAAIKAGILGIKGDE